MFQNSGRLSYEALTLEEWFPAHGVGGKGVVGDYHYPFLTSALDRVSGYYC